MHIEPDIIERLLTDRALGETHADVDALLDAYLAEDPRAAAAHRSIDGAVALAGAVLADDVAINPPLLDAARINTALQRRRARRYLLNAAALAAVLLIGVAIGSFNRSNPSARPAFTTAGPQPDERSKPSHFWSAQRIIALAAQRTDRPKRTPWTWTALTNRADDREVLQ